MDTIALIPHLGSWRVAGWIWWDGESAPALVVLYVPGEAVEPVHVPPSVAAAAGVPGAMDWPAPPHAQIVMVATETTRVRAAYQAREQLLRGTVADAAAAAQGAGSSAVDAAANAVERLLGWLGRGVEAAGEVAGRTVGKTIGGASGAAAGAGVSGLQSTAPWWLLPAAGAVGVVILIKYVRS